MTHARSGRIAVLLVLALLFVGGASYLFLTARGGPEPSAPLGIGPGGTVEVPNQPVEKPTLEDISKTERVTAAPEEPDVAELLGGTPVGDVQPSDRTTRQGELVVRVVDAQGKPQENVPVAIGFDRGDRPFHFLVVHTDSIGESVFRDVADRLPPQEHGEPGYAVTLAIPKAERVRIPIDPTALPAQVIQLELPSTGSLAVRLKSSDGSFIVDSALVGLGPPGDPQENFRTYESRRAENGVARFPLVGLNESLRVRVVVGGRPPHAQIIEGPTEAGKEAVVEITLQDSFPELVGRAVGPNGQPLGSSRVQLRIHQPGGATRDLQAISQADGTFTVRLFEQQAEAPERIEFSVAEADAGFEAEMVGIQLAAQGPTQLGDILFRTRPLAAAGRIVDENGKPLGGVNVRLESSQEGQPFRTLRGVTSTTGREGRFQLFASPPAGRLRLVARRRGYEPTIEDIGVPGLNGLELILRKRAEEPR